jgi:hypothetical protein
VEKIRIRKNLTGDIKLWASGIPPVGNVKSHFAKLGMRIIKKLTLKT